MGRNRTNGLFKVGDIVKNMKIIDVIDIIYGTKGRTTKGYKYKCIKDCYEGTCTHDNLLKMKGCPVCSNKIIVCGINDIPTTHPWIVKYFIKGESEARKYTYGSGAKIPMKCPDCGYEKVVRINSLTYQKFGCPRCDDGISMPNKIMFNLLSDSGIEFKNEYSPEWANGKRYDFYVEKYNTIIEMNGQQHYIKTFNNKPLYKEIENDKYKESIAIKNGIKKYIQIDCRKSDFDFIEDSILNSDLCEVLNIKTVDWPVILEKSIKSKIVDVCEMWNSGTRMEDIMNKLKLSKSSVCRYLNVGNKLNMCNYCGKSEIAKAAIYVHGKPLEVLKNGISQGIFQSTQQASEYILKNFNVTVKRSSISRVCRGERKSHKGFTFKYIDENN